MKEQGWRVHKLRNGYMRWLRQQKQGSEFTIREDSPAYGLTDPDIDELMDVAIEASASTLQRFNVSTN